MAIELNITLTEQGVYTGFKPQNGSATQPPAAANQPRWASRHSRAAKVPLNYCRIFISAVSALRQKYQLWFGQLHQLEASQAYEKQSLTI